MKLEILKHPTEEDWMLCKTCTLVTVSKNSNKPPTEEWKHALLKSQHSPIRTLQFCFRLTDIPYWVSVHLCRHIHAVRSCLHKELTDRTSTTEMRLHRTPGNNVLVYERRGTYDYCT